MPPRLPRALSLPTSNASGPAPLTPLFSATAGDLPTGYCVDRSEVVVGEGEQQFVAAKSALAHFQHYDSPAGRIRIIEPRPELAEDAVVSLLGCHMGIWTLSACRVVYVFDEPTSFGFAYGTLEHAVRGEERFEVALLDDGSVVFRLLAFSVPASLLISLGKPLARIWQRRAGREYGEGLRAAMQAASMRSAPG